MEELKKQLMEQDMLSEDQALRAITTVSAFIKQRIPAVMHGQLDKIFEGHTLEENIRTQIGDLGNEIKSKAEVLAKDLQNSFDKTFGSKK